ncbi:MAG: hypothetical protein HC883_04295 [Bdellovibrionaceae bacterium]|nr:hypothetical protein [Pseudobdellovibrionaceae bacterium]
MVMRLMLSAIMGLSIVSCDPGGGGSTAVPSTAADYTGGYIYVASGTVYAGNSITTATPVNVVARFKKTDGSFDSIIRDYTNSPPDSPVDIVDWDEDHLLVLVENATSRRVEIVAKDGSSYTSWITNATALSAQLRRMMPTPDGGLLVSKGTMIEKFNASGSRITQGANAFIQSPAGSCATTATLNSAMSIGPSNNIFVVHAAASPHAQINIINASG